MSLSIPAQSDAGTDLTLDPAESRRLRVEVANHGYDELLMRTYAAPRTSPAGAC